MRRYAEGTTVPEETSRADIERTLRQYGAARFGYQYDDDRAAIAFELCGRRIVFYMPLPTEADVDETESGKKRLAQHIAKALEQERRRRWRALFIMIKAKLEAVETGIVTFEEEFLPHTIMPDGRTVAEHVNPAVALAYQSGKMPAGLLPDYSGGRK